MVVSALVKENGDTSVAFFDMSVLNFLTGDVVWSGKKAHHKVQIPSRGKYNTGGLRNITSGESAVYICGEINLDPGGAILKVAKPTSEKRPKSVRYLIPAKINDNARFHASDCIAISPENYVVFAERVEEQSVLNFVGENGQINGRFPTGLSHVTAFAYGPNHGDLFLSDFATGAIYKLIEADNESGCQTERVMDLESVTAMKFNAAGELYVTQLGPKTATDGGKLLKITGLDVAQNSEVEVGGGQ